MLYIINTNSFQSIIMLKILVVFSLIICPIYLNAQGTPCMKRCFDIATNRCMEKCGKGAECEHACHEKIQQPCHDYCQSSPF